MATSRGQALASLPAIGQRRGGQLGDSRRRAVQGCQRCNEVPVQLFDGLIAGEHGAGPSLLHGVEILAGHVLDHGDFERGGILPRDPARRAFAGLG